MGQWDVVRLIPGHGGQGDASTIRGQRAYLAAMINGVRDGKGSSADDLVKQIDLLLAQSVGPGPGAKCHVDSGDLRRTESTLSGVTCSSILPP